MTTPDSKLAYKFVQAKHYGPYNNLPVNRLVVHDMEYPERPTGAEWCADYFAQGERIASAHYCCDSDSIVQCVSEAHIAYHAPPNTHSIGIEHAGYSAQSRADWLDAYSTAELKLSAKLAADICKRHNIPIVKLSVADLKAGKRGICGHRDVSDAFHKTDHGDPGANFPWDDYLGWVREATNGQEDDMAQVPQAEWDQMKKDVAALRADIEVIKTALIEKDDAKVKAVTGRSTGGVMTDAFRALTLLSTIDRNTAPPEQPQP